MFEIRAIIYLSFELVKILPIPKRLFHARYQFYLGDVFGPFSISLTSLLIIKEWLLLMGNEFRYCSIQLSVPTDACLRSGKSYPSRRVFQTFIFASESDVFTRLLGLYRSLGNPTCYVDTQLLFEIKKIKK